MTLTLLKIALSALAVGGINAIAQSSPRVGGWIAALPLISFLSIIWLAADGASTSDITVFIGRVIIGQIPTVILLAIVLAGLSYGLSVTLAMVSAGIAWIAFSVAARHLGLFD